MIATENISARAMDILNAVPNSLPFPATFPAFWLQSPRHWPGERGIDFNGAEIGIFEYFPHAKRDSVAHTLHYGGYKAGHRVAAPVWGTLQPSKDHFHTFGLEWTPDSYKTFVDGIQLIPARSLSLLLQNSLYLAWVLILRPAGPVQLSGLPDRFVVIM